MWVREHDVMGVDSVIEETTTKEKGKVVAESDNGCNSQKKQKKWAARKLNSYRYS